MSAVTELPDLQRKVLNFLGTSGHTVKKIQAHLKALGLYYSEPAINEALRSLGDKVQAETVLGERRWRKATPPVQVDESVGLFPVIRNLRAREAGGGS